MDTYRHLLAAVDLDEDGLRVLRRAAALARAFGARLSAAHVVEYLPLDPAADAMLSTPIDLSEARAQAARVRLEHWRGELGLAPGSMHVAIGPVTGELLRLRSELGADLIVVGHHARHGLAALFGHTEDGVLARAECDVLAVYLDEDSGD